MKNNNTNIYDEELLELNFALSCALTNDSKNEILKKITSTRKKKAKLTYDEYEITWDDFATY